MSIIDRHSVLFKNTLPVLILLGAWAVVIWIVDPVGEFMVNDDWSFVRCIEDFQNTGKLGPTGWGPPGREGGPALIVHILWGWVFTQIFGFSLTVLRINSTALGSSSASKFAICMSMSSRSDTKVLRRRCFGSLSSSMSAGASPINFRDTRRCTDQSAV